MNGNTPVNITQNDWTSLVQDSWPPKLQIQTHELFEWAPNKRRKGLIWHTSIDKTHSRNFFILFSFKMANPLTRSWK